MTDVHLDGKVDVLLIVLKNQYLWLLVDQFLVVLQPGESGIRSCVPESLASIVVLAKGTVGCCSPRLVEASPRVGVQ